MHYSICDLHCDLLAYLAHDASRTALDSIVRCSFPQLEAGKVISQVLPIFTPTEANSVVDGLSQLAVFKELNSTPTLSTSFSLAVENASSFCDEMEPLASGLSRLKYFREQSPIFYISMTWNSENRFGGGAHTHIGLKPDGEQLLQFLHDKTIAIDLSHASDELAFGILDYIARKNLRLPIIASHSNFRTVTCQARNLPDEIAKEIILRDGLIGLNFVKLFVGPSPDYFIKQLEHGLKLGAENHLCFGADFFYEGDVPAHSRKKSDEYWFDDFGNSSEYKKVIELWKGALKMPESLIFKICEGNFKKFVNRL